MEVVMLAIILVKLVKELLRMIAPLAFKIVPQYLIIGYLTAWWELVSVNQDILTMERYLAINVLILA